MSGKILFDGGIKSQPVAAVESLSKYLNKEIKGGVLDMGRVKLILSGDRKSFYAVSATDCSCPAKYYQHGQQCKHQRKHFSAPQAPAREIKTELLIDAVAWQTTEGEITYWQQKEQQQQTEKLSPGQQLARNIVEAMEA